MESILKKKGLRQPGQAKRPLHEVDGHDGKNFRRGFDAQEQFFLQTAKCYRCRIDIVATAALDQRRLRQW